MELAPAAGVAAGTAGAVIEMTVGGLMALPIGAAMLASELAGDQEMTTDASGAPVPVEPAPLQAGDAGSYDELTARGKPGDDLTAHHMPQAAAGRTGYGEGGALALPTDEHKQTRTYGSRGRKTVKEDEGKSFRDVLAEDIRDVRRITGSKYNQGLRGMTDYYRRNFPNLMKK